MITEKIEKTQKIFKLIMGVFILFSYIGVLFTNSKNVFELLFYGPIIVVLLAIFFDGILLIPVDIVLLIFFFKLIKEKNIQKLKKYILVINILLLTQIIVIILLLTKVLNHIGNDMIIEGIIQFLLGNIFLIGIFIISLTLSLVMSHQIKKLSN